MTAALRLAIVLAVAVAAAIVANVVLLGVASGGEEPVGRLSPRGEVQATATTVATVSSRPPVLPRADDTRSRGSEGDGRDD